MPQDSSALFDYGRCRHIRNMQHMQHIKHFKSAMSLAEVVNKQNLCAACQIFQLSCGFFADAG